jgi:hypothetical protein
MSNNKSTQGAVWLKTLHQWHWISSALCLVGMLLFAVTGITLNHASQIESKPVVVSKKATLPAPLQAELRRIVRSGDEEPAADTPLPQPVHEWLRANLSIDTEGKSVEWSPDEAYVALARPGGDAWVRIGLADGQVEYELTDRGWVSWLNDLHKGRNTGVAWSWFIDIFAGLCLVFCITGLLILKFHAAKRPITWPIVGLGLLLPALLALLFIH